MDALLNPIDALRQQAAEQATTETLGSSELGRDEFLKLLVAKLGNQDPLQPSQDEEFIAQLATFSSLEQLIDLNSRIDVLAAGQSSLINTQAFGLVGKDALIDAGDTLRVDGDIPDDLVYTVNGRATSATLTVTDLNGNLKGTIDLDVSAGGRIDVDWSQLEGEELTDGLYTIQATAVGEDVSIDVFRSLPIDGVNFSEGFIQLVSGNDIIDFNTILEIRQSSQG